MHLRSIYSKPLEREFEAWTVSCIEKYFTALGLTYAIWAVSPADEVNWPADEKLSIKSKLIGLQFKQAKLRKNKTAADRLYWSLHQPPKQFDLIKAHTEIFYCLPTFINRNFRSQALYHCLFWRPGEEDDKNVWYDNGAADTPYRKIRDAMRWGHFIESILFCSIGELIESPSKGQAAINSIMNNQRELFAVTQEKTGGPHENGSGLYLLAIEIPT